MVHRRVLVTTSAGAEDSCAWLFTMDACPQFGSGQNTGLSREVKAKIDYAGEIYSAVIGLIFGMMSCTTPMASGCITLAMMKSGM